MDFGEGFTRWTARLALVLYVTALSLRLGAAPKSPAANGARWTWTLGCLVFVAHVAAAFQYYHHWSHAAAYEATAARTAEVTSWRWGGGLYGNYLFLLVWAADVAFWWLGGNSRYLNRGKGWEIAVQGFLGFMFFNATLVFGHGVIRWLASAGVIALVIAWLRGRSRRITASPRLRD